jgi:NTP pyrophosphatase (non-canonical NTP hydrolase)
LIGLELEEFLDQASKNGGKMHRMKNASELAGLSAMIKTFCDERDWDQFHSPKEISIAMTIEAAELLDLFRFKSDEQIRGVLTAPDSREKVQDELADVFYWLLRFAEREQIDLAEALRAKMKKNAAKYPVEKAKGNNQKYTEYK